MNYHITGQPVYSNNNLFTRKNKTTDATLRLVTALPMRSEKKGGLPTALRKTLYCKNSQAQKTKSMNL